MATEPKPITTVKAEELVYRSVPDTNDHHTCGEDGQLIRLGHSAFNDPARHPSVDRVELCSAGAEASRRGDAHGVVWLGVADVRQIKGVVTLDKHGVPVREHAVDVKHDPVPENYAHAVVEAAPEVANSAWKRLKEALCIIAARRGWACKPQSARRDDPPCGAPTGVPTR